MASSRDGLRLPLAAAEPVSASSNAPGAPPTLTTPTLTPTTLRNIEQMFMDTEAQEPDNHAHAARFEPPLVPIPLIGPSSTPAAGAVPPVMNAPPTVPTNLIMLPSQEVPTAPILKLKEECIQPQPAWVSDGSVLPGPESNEKHEQMGLIAATSVAAETTGATTQPQCIELPNVPLKLLPTQPVLPEQSAAVTNNNNGPLSLPENTLVLPISSGATTVSLAPEPTIPAVPNLVSTSSSTSFGAPPTVLLPVDDIAKTHNACLSLPTAPVMPSALVITPAKEDNASVNSSGKSLSSGRKAARSGDVHLSPEELQKKVLRRQRNKEAAARCRKRRLDQTMTLQEEVDDLEKEKADTEAEIRTLEAQKSELENILQAHRDRCKAAKEVRTQSATSTSSLNIFIKEEKPEDTNNKTAT